MPTTPKSPRTRVRSPSADKAPLHLGPLKEFVGFHIRMAQLVVYADFVRGQSSPTLTPGLFGVLVLIDQNPDSTQQRLCDAIGVDKSTLVATLHRLSERGLIRRVRSTVDRRQNALVLSAKGKAKLRAMLTHVREHERKIMARLSPEECAQLVSLLRRIG
jgi:DNA-binding MarR family transcriptional regulator